MSKWPIEYTAKETTMPAWKHDFGAAQEEISRLTRVLEDRKAQVEALRRALTEIVSVLGLTV